jgi:hypothetical protein
VHNSTNSSSYSRSVVVIIMLVVIIIMIATSPLVPRPTGAEGGESTAPLCLQALRVQQLLCHLAVLSCGASYVCRSNRVVLQFACPATNLQHFHARTSWSSAVTPHLADQYAAHQFAQSGHVCLTQQDAVRAQQEQLLRVSNAGHLAASGGKPLHSFLQAATCQAAAAAAANSSMHD